MIYYTFRYYNTTVKKMSLKYEIRNSADELIPKKLTYICYLRKNEVELYQAEYSFGIVRKRKGTPCFRKSKQLPKYFTLMR